MLEDLPLAADHKGDCPIVHFRVGARDRRVERFDALFAELCGQFLLELGEHGAHFNMDEAFFAGRNNAVGADGVFLDMLRL